jgi:hypothetical protein
MNTSAIYVLAILALSAIEVRARAKRGTIVTPSGGLHLQVLLFYGIGGVFFVFFPDGEPSLVPTEIDRLVAESGLPFLVGYAVTCVVEKISRLGASVHRVGAALRSGELFSGTYLLILAIAGLFGFVMSTLGFGENVSQMTAYSALLFYPSVLLFLMNRGRVFGLSPTTAALVMVLFAIGLGFASPWRSILVILAGTVVVSLILRAPKWAALSVAIGVIACYILLPFQIIKRDNVSDLRASASDSFYASLQLTADERNQLIAQFAVRRLSYMRELSYVQRYTEINPPLDGVNMYIGSIAQQLIPRVLWPEKPEVAHWVGFILPRDLGLLQHTDPHTSWAINAFAEASFFFGTWSLIAFIPLFFFVLGYLDKFLVVFKDTRSRVLASTLLFYLFLSATTAIFLASQVVVVFLIALTAEALSARGVGRSIRLKRGFR